MKNLSPLFNTEFDCEDLVQCFYNLSELEFNIYCTLLKMSEDNIGGTVSKIQDFMGRKEKTMINRSLKHLFEQGLVSRTAETVKTSENNDNIGIKTPKRGYFYIYKPLPLDVLVVELKERLEAWHQNSLLEIEKIIPKFREKLAKYNKISTIKIES
jgi:predicted transcriptional regulator